ncbi:hypothetical protein PRNP1_008374 [Phytophthora ramorum]
MMHEDEDDAKYEEKDVAAKAAPSDEEESDVQSTRNQGSTQREEDSNAGEKSAVSSDERAGESGGATGLSVRADDAKQRRATPELDIESKFHAFSADDDDDEGNYQIVKKSIYKPHRKGFLSRFAPVASTKQKYLSEITGIVTGEEVEAAKDCEEKSSGNVDLAIEEEEEDDIQVSIDRSAHTPRRSRGSHDRRRLSAEDAALGGPSEVVIHSGDSDLGFATLNPIINSNAQRSAPNHGDFVAPAMTKSTGVPVAKAKPILLEIPVAEQATPARDRLLLIINALGATGLPKAEKFGTQSCFLEMRLFDDTNMLDAHSTTSWSSYLMRTELHKKGGSEAQWNQQFTTTLRSKETQFLHVDVKTSSKILVGEANVPLDKVGDLFYDQHYPLFRSEDNDENSNDPVLLSAGQVHLQLKIVDTVAVPLPPTVIPPLQLPLFTSLESTQSGVKSPLTAKPIPAVLLNGGLFFKIPYHSHNMVGYANGLRRQWVAVRRATDPPHLQITWGDPTLSGSAERKSLRSLDLALVAEIREGNTTAAFAAQTESNIVKEKDKCFSLVTRARTLDLVAASKEEARIWINNLRELLFASEKSVDVSLLSARTIEAYKQSALSPREQEDSSGMKATPAVAPTKRMVAAWRNRIFNLARHDKVDDVMECLEDGCPIDLLESGSGDTLLMLACRLGNAELVELCLSRRAKNDPHPEFGETALQVAVTSSHAHCVGLLLSTAAKSDMDSEIVNHIDPNNDAPLHVAGRHGDLACLQLLLHHGADICVVEEFGRTPLHCAVANGNLDCVAYLLDVGGDSVLNSGDHDGDTALHYAALSGNEAIVKLLLESAANVFATNVQKETAYDIAVREKQQRQVAPEYAQPLLAYWAGTTRQVSSLMMDSRVHEVPPPIAWDQYNQTIPSPRSKSPIKKFLEGAEEDATSNSFGKSRASSPRGRSKNIQLIELKRANNLALALASFKIHDHYEQIVNDIVKMDERVVNPALLGCLQRFFPTEKEKQALQSFNGSISTLGKAEHFFCLLFQVPGMQERIDMFLYKMEFTRTHSSLLARILIVKRACRDLVENFSFIQALERFFKKQQMTSFSVFQDNKTAFISEHLSEADEKLRSFRGDLEKAMGVELVELQLQMNRLVAGIRPIRSFVNRSPSSTSGQSEDRDGKARDILHRFLVDTRSLLSEIETEFEAMELWGDRLLAVFGESKATFQISAILHAVVELL